MAEQNRLTDAFAEQSTPVDTFLPSIIEEKGGMKRVVDLPSRLLEEGIIYMNSPVTDEAAAAINMQIMHLVNQNKDIKLYINSPGGSISAGLAIYDMMRYAMAKGRKVETYGTGMCASMASFLLSAGTPGHRYLLPNTKDMTHQPAVQGMGHTRESDMDAQRKSMGQIRRRMERYYAHFMGIEYNDESALLIKKFMEEDTYLNGYMAKELGLIDQVLMEGGANISDPYLAESLKISEELDKQEFDEIDSDPEGTDRMRYVKRLIEYRKEHGKSTAVSNDNSRKGNGPSTQSAPAPNGP